MAMVSIITNRLQLDLRSRGCVALLPLTEAINRGGAHQLYRLIDDEVFSSYA